MTISYKKVDITMSIPESAIAPLPQECPICLFDLNSKPKLKLDTCCQKEVHRDCLIQWVRTCARNLTPQKCPCCNVETLPSDREIQANAAGETDRFKDAIRRVSSAIEDLFNFVVRTIDDSVGPVFLNGFMILKAAIDLDSTEERGPARIVLLTLGITLAAATTIFFERQIPPIGNVERIQKVYFTLRALLAVPMISFSTGLNTASHIVIIQVTDEYFRDQTPPEIDNREIVKKIRDLISGIGGAMIGACAGLSLTKGFVHRRSYQLGMTAEVVNGIAATILGAYLTAFVTLGGARALSKAVEQSASKALGKITLSALTALSISSADILVEGNKNVDILKLAGLIGTVVGLLLNGGRNVFTAQLIGVVSFLYFSYLITTYFRYYEYAYQSRTFQDYASYFLG